MITIGICDDDPVFTEDLYNIIDRVMFSIGDWKPRIFHSCQEILDAIDNGDFDCQLLFMDIITQSGNGFTTAQHISKHNLNTDLIFVTASKEHVFECYHYHAFAYLLKPVSEMDISSELQRYLHSLHYSPKHLTISFKGITSQIPVNSILYIESNLRKLIIHTQQATYHCYQKLDDIAKQLAGNGFVRCHQSYLVALDKITRHTSSHIYIQDTQIPISNRYQPTLKKIFANPPATSATEGSTPSSLSQTRKEYGALVCIHGAYLGSIIHIKPEQKIFIGRDGSIVDMVINLPLVSRNHCSLLYHCDTMEYELTDFSNNGTFINRDKRVLPNETYLLKPGTEICFGDRKTVYKLG